MKDFWAWASAHYFLAFILAWVAMVIVGQVLTAFFRIFHRPKLSADQLRTLRNDLLTALREVPDLRLDLTGSTRLARTVDELNREHLPSPGPPPRPSRSRPWYDRLR